MSKREWIENILIFLAIFSIWPVVFRWPGKGYTWIMVFFIGILIFILIRRAVRIRKLFIQLRKELYRDYEKFDK